MCAYQYINIPYQWGGNGPFTFDCSGLLVRSIKDYYELIDKPRWAKNVPDMTMQGIHDWSLAMNGYSGHVDGALCFYGESVRKITHGAIAGQNGLIIEAGGAGRDTDRLQYRDLRDYCGPKNARVRIKRFDHRTDLVGCIKLRGL